MKTFIAIIRCEISSTRYRVIVLADSLESARIKASDRPYCGPSEVLVSINPV